jgi:hypothetical protein
MRRRFGQALMSMAAVGVLFVSLVALDDRVREQLSLRFDDHPSAQLATAGSELRDMTTVVIDAARDQSIEHAPLMIFVLAATVLLLFMLRT